MLKFSLNAAMSSGCARRINSFLQMPSFSPAYLNEKKTEQKAREWKQRDSCQSQKAIGKGGPRDEIDERRNRENEDAIAPPVPRFSIAREAAVAGAFRSSVDVILSPLRLPLSHPAVTVITTLSVIATITVNDSLSGSLTHCDRHCHCQWESVAPPPSSISSRCHCRCDY